MILDRDAVEFDPVYEGADGVENGVPATAGLQQIRCRPVGPACGRGLERLLEGGAGSAPLGLVGGGGDPVAPAPRRLGPIDPEIQAHGKAGPGIAVCGMKPAAAEIEREIRL